MIDGEAAPGEADAGKAPGHKGQSRADPPSLWYEEESHSCRCEPGCVDDLASCTGSKYPVGNEKVAEVTSGDREDKDRQVGDGLGGSHVGQVAAFADRGSRCMSRARAVQECGGHAPRSCPK